MKILPILFCALGASLCAEGAPEAYANPALNPVKFEQAEQHAALPLVKDGKLNFVIVRDGKAERGVSPRRRSVALAVEALCDAFERTTGQTPRVADADSDAAEHSSYVIAVGRSPLTERLGVKVSDLPKEAFRVRSFKRGVVIAGHDGSLIPGSYNAMDWDRYRINGTLNGAYDFIERVLGVRYYYPGIGIVAPKITDLELPALAYRDEPCFRNRFNYAYNLEFRKGLPWKDVKNENNFDFAWRLAMSTRFNEVCHSPDPHYLLAAYPDKKDVIFFRDSSGYQYYNPATHIGNLMDITNPELAHLLVRSFKKYYETNGKWRAPWSNGRRTWYPPNSEYVLFGQADTFVHDLISDKNRHLFPASRRGSSAGMLSDLYVNFYCWIGKELKKELPGKRLGVLAYHNYTLPPVVCRDIPDNIDVQVCAGRIVMSKADATRKQWREIFKGWYDALGGRPVTAWTYGAQGTAFTQAIQGRYMRDYINCIRPWLSRDGLFFDASGLRWNFYYSYYGVYRAFWNPDFNYDAALEEHWEKLYGAKAGDALRKFYRLLVERWEKVYIAGINNEPNSVANSNVTPDRLYRAYHVPTIEKLERYLREAFAATRPGSVERRRVEFFAAPWKKDFTAARAYASLVIPVYEVKQLGADEQIEIDGKIKENVWKRAGVIPMRDARGSGAELVSKPQGRMLWDKNGIYLAFTCSGKPAVNRGDVWFGSDNIEFFLSPGNDKAVYYQFAVSPGGDWVDAYKVEKPMEAALDAKWVCGGVKYAVSASENAWSVEVYIPFQGLHNRTAPRAYQTWFGNLVNNKLAPDKKPAEYSAFSMTMGNNHNHSLWGKFKFMGKGD